MPRYERICPECGASNSFKRTSCVKCGAPLTRLAIPQTPTLSPLSRRGIAKLAWKATKILTRAGFNLAKRGAQTGIDRVRHERVRQERKAADVKSETIDGEYKLREWRVWSKGSDKTEQTKTERVHWGSKK